MKKIASLLCAALLAVAARAAEALPQFNATLTVGKEHRFVLIGDGGKASGFLNLGEKFEGYTLKAYDAKSGVLDLERDGKVTQVSLVGNATIANGPGATTATKATAADAEELLKMMRFEEMLGKMMDAQKRALGPAMQQSVSQSLARANINLSPEDRAALDTLQSQMVGDVLGAITGPEMQSAVAKIYSDTFTKEEMNSMAAFYATPAGQALNDKQPVVQEKMMEVMMPLMMQRQQAAQQKMAGFMNELRTKYRPGAPGAPAANPGSTPAQAPAAPSSAPAPAPAAPKN